MMSVKRLVFFLLIFISFQTLASSSDSLVRLHEVKFESDFEKEMLTRAITKQAEPDYLALFMATDKTSTTSAFKEAEKKVSEIFAVLDKEELDKKSEAKKIKLIYKTVHDSFFKKYEYKNNFSEIFKNGNYNCLSASALYSIVLNKYHIPYSIKKAPGHVFLLTYPSTYKILIETTDPVKGYFEYNEQMIANYVNHLKKSKMISEEEFKNKSQNELFEQYFLKDENVSIRQLVGLQYNNLALYEFENEKYLEAFQMMQKAYLFYPTEGTKFLLRNMLLALLSKANYDNEDDVTHFAYLTRFKTDETGDLNVEAISSEFVRITQKQLISKSNFSLYSKSYLQISKSIVDTTLRKEIDFIYNYEYARAVLNSGREENIDQHIKTIYSIKPEHMEVQTMISSYVINGLRKFSNPETVLLALDKCSKQYTFLSGTNKIASIYGACYLELAALSFARNDITKGDHYLVSFENVLKGKEKSLVDEFLINKSFAEASAAYYRKGNMSKAKGMITKGLEYAPDSPYLQLRLSSFSK
jgi:hypothetical protein